MESRDILDILFDGDHFEDNPRTEESLAQQFGTSRSPIRNALLELERDGVIERKKKKGVYLKKPDIKKIAEIYDLRTILEGFAVRQAMERMQEEDLVEFERICEAIKRSIKHCDASMHNQSDVRFHQKIIELSGNHTLGEIIFRFQIIRESFLFHFPLRKIDLHEYESPYGHSDIVKTLKEGDVDGCEEQLRMHIQMAKKEIVEMYLGFRVGNLE